MIEMLLEQGIKIKDALLVAIRFDTAYWTNSTGYWAREGLWLQLFHAASAPQNWEYVLYVNIAIQQTDSEGSYYSNF
jgi:hypothetical protein